MVLKRIRAIPFLEYVPMRLTITLLLFLSIFHATAQVKELKTLKGFVKNGELQTLSFTIIYNNNTKQTYSANEFGAFVIQAAIGDSLIVSRLAYKTDTVVVSAAVFYETINFVIALRRQDVQLKDVNVRRRHKNDSLAQAMAEIMKRDTLLNNNRRKENYREMAKPKFISQNGIGVEGLIYKTWYKYSTEGKNNEKLLSIINLYNQFVQLDDKLSIEYIMKVTGVNEKKAEYIKKYCAKTKLLKKDYNDYDIIVALKECALE
ncbi:MAG: hypothetical protein V4538_03550 [Bacteroidota bacterium]